MTQGLHQPLDGCGARDGARLPDRLGLDSRLLTLAGNGVGPAGVEAALRVRSAAALQSAWRDAAGELIGQHSRVVGVRRGKLEVIVGHSALLQELTFRKAALLAALTLALPDEPIKDFRFRVGALDG